MSAKIGVPVVTRLVNCEDFSYTAQVAEAASGPPETVSNALQRACGKELSSFVAKLLDLLELNFETVRRVENGEGSI